MDETLSSLEKINPNLTPDAVSPTQHSEPDKSRKFAQELKDKMEEEREKRKKDKKQDVLVLHENELDDTSLEENKNMSQQDNHESVPDEEGREKNNDKLPEHIDVKA